MRSEKIDGIGSVHEGEYDTIQIDGIGKLKGNASANNIIIDGMFKSKGKINAQQMTIDGIARVFRDIKVKNIKIDGVLKLRRASLSSEKITCDGVLVCNREVTADEIYIDGVCSIAEIYGDKIKINNNINGWKDSKIPTKFLFLVNMYMGRDISLTHSIVDNLECTFLEANGIKSKIIRANNVNLKNCIVQKLYCDGEIIIDDNCKIGEIISKNQNIIRKKESNYMSDTIKVNNSMANTTLVKILDLYKKGSINANEAEKMLDTINMHKTVDEKVTETSWVDDGKLRIVAYIGTKLLKKGEVGNHNLEVEYKGEALDVESYGNLTCGNIGRNASTGGSIKCGDIGGNLSCGGSVICNNTNGNVAAGGGVRINKL